MSFMNSTNVEVAMKLQDAHFEFARAGELRRAFNLCLEDYCAKAMIEQPFEARGLLVTGHSRVGKTKEIRKLISAFNASGSLMPDGRPGKVVHCLLKGTVTWKDLGLKVLEAFGYPVSDRRTQNYIWGQVVHQARERGVIGVHFDEVQHVFSSNKASNRIILDSFKALLKDDGWPLILILSGVPILAKQVHEEEQLEYLLNPVHFDTIHIEQSVKSGDEDSDFESIQ